MSPDQLYLDLMKKCLTRLIFTESYAPLKEPRLPLRRVMWRGARTLLEPLGLELVRRAQSDRERRESGLDWPAEAETMIGMKRLDNLQFCVEEALRRNVPGDLMETGVWRGGATIFMRAVLEAHGIRDRRVWVADSFQGLPKPDAASFPADAGDRLWTYATLTVSIEEVKDNFRRYGLLDDQVVFLPGWFRDTMPAAPVERLAVLRLDGDLYESTIVVLRNLYGKVSPGGFVIIDDFILETCRRAVEDFRAAESIADEIVPIDGVGVYWQKHG
ncbi:MAG: TylF/MycF family methyltransferase [Thermoanaerobaculia bacterium]